MFRVGIRSLKVVRLAATSARLQLAATRNSHAFANPHPEENVTNVSSIADDQRLVHTSDFIGVSSYYEKPSQSTVPETVLSMIQESLRKNYRISGATVLIDVVRRLEQSDARLISTLTRSSDRWVPMLIATCGYPMSNVHKRSRELILDRMWTQILKHDFSLSLPVVNRRLEVLLHNETVCDPQLELDNILNKWKLEPNNETFNLLLEHLSKTGNTAACKNMVYEMARHGFIVDMHSNASLVYCFAIKGLNSKADSLTKLAEGKYGAEGVRLAQGACARAAAALGDTDRLRIVLRRSVQKSGKRLEMSVMDVFNTVWLLVDKKNEPGHDVRHVPLIEQMLNCVMRDAGFFRLLFREVERHICHEHYYSSIALLEDTKRIADCLRHQQKSSFYHHLLSRMCRQLIRTEVAPSKINDIANRINYALKNLNYRIYDDLMYAVLMFRDFSMDKRMEYTGAFVDRLDLDRRRHHIVLPLLAQVENVEDRLKLIFRCSKLGYDDISQHEIGVFSSLVLQPLFNVQKSHGKNSRMDSAVRVLKSFGVSDVALWNTLYRYLIFRYLTYDLHRLHTVFVNCYQKSPHHVVQFLLLDLVYPIGHEWFKLRVNEEKSSGDDVSKRPRSSELQGWLRAHYSSTFERGDEDGSSLTKIVPTNEKLLQIIHSGDTSRLHLFLTTYGWPGDTNLSEVAPNVLELYLEHESWANVQEMLNKLSVYCNRLPTDEDSSPLKNYHLLQVLRRMVQEESEFSPRNLVNYLYEMKHLFPNAVAKYETFFETMHEYQRLFSKCFELMPHPSVAKIEECIDLLRTLVKLGTVQLHQNETLTAVIVKNVLGRMGWSEAVNTWLKFQSGLHCVNGSVVLMNHAILMGGADAAQNVQYIVHRMQLVSSASRAHSLLAAVLVSLRRWTEAESQLKNNAAVIVPMDCVMAMRLMNALKFKKTDEEFCERFCEMTLRLTALGEDLETAKILLADCIKNCQARNLAPLALRLYDLFESKGVELPPEEKQKLWAMVDKHQLLAKRWIYAPKGLLRISETDDIVQDTRFYRLQQKLRTQIETS